MKKIIFLFVILAKLSVSYSQTATLSGYIKDNNNSENLIGASVYIMGSSIGCATNENGYYSIAYNKGNTIKLAVSFIGYRKQIKEFYLQNDTVVNFNLHVNNDLESITVTAENINNQKAVISNLQIPLKDIKLLPTISGEPDVMKVFQLMPGVQSGAEGSSAIYVRGGSPDQNLFLIDGIPLYYVYHLGGYVSVFDGNAINSMQLLKGGFPARYGGRLSSVIDMRMKDGDTKKYHGEIMLGVLSSKIFLQGPLKKDKTTFMLSFRRSNIDLFTRSITKISMDSYTAAYTFYDFYTKINHKFSQRNSLSFSAYSGRDRFSFDDNESPNSNNPYSINPGEMLNYHSHFYTDWGNRLANIRWSHLFKTKLYGNFSLSYSKFYYNTQKEFTIKDSSNNILLSKERADYLSGINDITFNTDFDYFPLSNYKLKFGVNAIIHTFNPGITNYLDINRLITEDTTIGNKSIHTREINFYVENELKITKKISANIGARATYYYTSDKEFYSLQPRAVINFAVSNNLSVKIAYSNIEQNLHVLTNSGRGVPTDIWLPASKTLKPESSNQYVLSTTYTTKNNKIDLTLEGYYKNMFNLIDFKDGASYRNTNSDWLKLIEPEGFGRVYGLEFMIRKNIGKTTGWISYTLSKNERLFENINGGNFYPATYDKRHDFTIVLIHQFNKKFSLSTNWIYYSGNMMTLAQLNYNIQLMEPISRDYTSPFSEMPFGIFDETGYYYGGKNNFRLPAYHRLDISFNYTKQKKHGNATWQVGIYNAYNKKNIYFLYYKNQGKDLYKFTLFPIIPSISYSFKF